MADAPEVVESIPAAYNRNPSSDKKHQQNEDGSPSDTIAPPPGYTTLASQDFGPQQVPPVLETPIPVKSEEEIRPDTYVPPESEGLVPVTVHSQEKQLNVQSERGVQQRRDAEKKDPQPGKWHNPLWACCRSGDLFCETIFCPCVIAGRTNARLKGNHDISSCNSYSTWFCFLSCFSMLGGLPCCWAMNMVKRRDIRHKYNIEGGGCRDCLVGGFCCWCALVQEEREVLFQEKEKEKEKYKESNQDKEGYRRVEGMAMAST